MNASHPGPCHRVTADFRRRRRQAAPQPRQPARPVRGSFLMLDEFYSDNPDDYVGRLSRHIRPWI